MKEDRIEILKGIKESLVEFMKTERFNQWDNVKDALDKALGQISIAIREAEENVEKKYIGVFFDYQNEERIKIPFYSSKRVGSYSNKLDAEFELSRVYRESFRSTMGIHFVEAYRAK